MHKLARTVLRGRKLPGELILNINLMKQTILFFTLFLLISCGKKENYNTPRQIVISGQISNYEPNDREIKIFANRLGFSPLNIATELDSLGNFQTVFKSFIPTDISIRYKKQFYVIVDPGDSIFVKLNALANNSKDFFKSIIISGDNAITNKHIVEFQKAYFSSKTYNNWESKQKAVKELDSVQYLKYLEKTQHQLDSIYNEFVQLSAPDERAADWAQYYIEQEYYNALFAYPFFHAMYNGQPTDMYRVPEGYFDTITSSLPIKDSKNIYGFAFSDFVKNYSSYIAERWQSEKQNQMYRTNGQHFSIPVNIADSIDIYSIIKYTPDTLLRQIILTKKFSDDFSKYSDIECFEQYQDIADKYIRLPFLKKPLYEQYSQLKERLQDPQYVAEVIEFAGSSTKQLIDTILHINNEKVIYIDCWATWCGPCKTEMPNSKELMKKMDGKDVAFVYLCLDSQEKVWKENLSQLEIGGQHYLLNQQQSSAFRKNFGIQGIPFYILLNKNGQVAEKGSQLRPNVAKYKIEELLNE
jgi:thiol-disulfide isomerase/thioredoxin